MAQFITTKGPMISAAIGAAAFTIWGYNYFYPTTREIGFSYLQIAEADGFTVKRIDEAYRMLQENGECNSLLKKHFTPKVKDQLKYKKTQLGSSLLDVIRSGVKNPDSILGVYAPDREAYTKFSALFDPIIEEYHGFGPDQKQPPSDFGEDKLQMLEDLDPEGKYIASTRISCNRTVQGFPFHPCLSRDTYLQLEGKLRPIFEELKNGGEKEIAGDYHRLENLTEEEQKQLGAQKLIFSRDNPFLEQIYAYQVWPSGRGIYLNNDKNFVVWLNEEDHLRIISTQEGGNVGQAFERLIKGVKALQSKVDFARDERLGWLTFSPSNLGTGILASVHIKLPKIGTRSDFKKTCEDLKLQITGIQDGLYIISNKTRLGLTEFEAVKQMYDGVKQLIELEKAAA